jgi:hypothetical protein
MPLAALELSQTDNMTVGELQMTISRCMCSMLRNYGEDALRVLALQMIAAGGSNHRAAVVYSVHTKSLIDGAARR